MNSLSTKVSSLAEDATSTVREVKELDERRPDFPGEHLFVLAAGSLLLLAGAKSQSMLGRGIMMGLGTALIGRAASGRGGVARVASALTKLR
ncbi:hypothetical protein H0A64_11180 [Alcaligenaceae bacterium]|nr:hypothetical protein [Alcaligenaceae bacterium]